MPEKRLGPTRRHAAAATVARKDAVPEALNQLNAYTAGYGAGALVPGGTRVIRLCSPGTFSPLSAVAFRGRNDGSSPSVNRSMARFTGTCPHTSTNTTSSRYGDQAITD